MHRWTCGYTGTRSRKEWRIKVKGLQEGADTDARWILNHYVMYCHVKHFHRSLTVCDLRLLLDFHAHLSEIKNVIYNLQTYDYDIFFHPPSFCLVMIFYHWAKNAAYLVLQFWSQTGTFMDGTSQLPQIQLILPYIISSIWGSWDVP